MSFSLPLQPFHVKKKGQMGLLICSICHLAGQQVQNKCSLGPLNTRLLKKAGHLLGSLPQEETMKYELLSPDSLTPQLKARRLELHNLLTLKLKAQKNTLAGHLRIEQKNGGRRIQFYHCTSTNSPRGAYIPCSQAALARGLAQKDYDRKLVKLLQRELSVLDKLLKNSDTKSIELYTKLCKARQRLITPVTLTDEQYIEK